MSRPRFADRSLLGCRLLLFDVLDFHAAPEPTPEQASLPDLLRRRGGAASLFSLCAAPLHPRIRPRMPPPSPDTSLARPAPPSRLLPPPCSHSRRASRGMRARARCVLYATLARKLGVGLQLVRLSPPPGRTLRGCRRLSTSPRPDSRPASELLRPVAPQASLPSHARAGGALHRHPRRGPAPHAERPGAVPGRRRRRRRRGGQAIARAAPRGGEAARPARSLPAARPRVRGLERERGPAGARAVLERAARAARGLPAARVRDTACPVCAPVCRCHTSARASAVCGRRPGGGARPGWRGGGVTRVR